MYIKSNPLVRTCPDPIIKSASHGGKHFPTGTDSTLQGIFSNAWRHFLLSQKWGRKCY